VDSASLAALFPDYEAGEGFGDVQGVAPGWDVAGVVTAAEVMALAFVQLSGILGDSSVPSANMAAWIRRRVAARPVRGLWR
jgi:hypothetical protein